MNPVDTVDVQNPATVDMGNVLFIAIVLMIPWFSFYFLVDSA